MASQLLASRTSTGPVLLTRSRWFKPASAQPRRGKRACIVSSASPLASWKENAANVAKGALLAAVLSGGIGMASPDVHLLQSARADDETGLSPAERRRNAVEKRKALLSKARETALSRGELAAQEGTAAGGDEQAQAAPSLFGVKPEAPQLATQPATPELPKVSPGELPKSSMPDKPKFTLPSKPPADAPPAPKAQVEKNVPKTESPALPVPPPAPKPAAPAAQAQPQTASLGGSGASQGINWDEYTRSKDSKPKTSPFAGVQPEKPQAKVDKPAAPSGGGWFGGGGGDSKPAEESSSISAATKARLAQQAKNAGKPVQANKRLAKRHGPPLFLVQLLLTIGLVGGLVAAIAKYDSMIAGATKLEKAIIQAVEKLQTSLNKA